MSFYGFVASFLFVLGCARNGFLFINEAVYTFTCIHLSDPFIQSDLQMRNTSNSS